MRSRVALLTAGLVVAFAGLAFGGQPARKPMERGQVILSWEEFIKITGYDPAKGGAQRLAIPWSEVESLLGVKVERVGKAATLDLPWGEFKALLEWSIRRKGGKLDAKPPTDYIIASTEYIGKLADETATFTLKAKINVLQKEGWKRIPILPGTVAVTSATLPDGVFLNAKDNMYELLTEKEGELEVSVEFSVSVEKAAGVNKVSFARVAVGSSVLDLSIARKDVDVKVSGAQSLVSKTAGDATQVVAALPSGTPINISWERALPKVEAAPTKLYAEALTLIAVAEGVLLCQETVQFNILHTAVRELKLKAPKGVSVLAVTGSSVQDWRVSKEGELVVVLSRETLGALSVSIMYEQAATDSVDAPVIRPTGVEREKGFIGVVAVANVEIAAGDVQGATTIDVRQLPADIAGMTNQPILLGFRYVGDAFTIPLTIKKHGEVGLLLTIVDSALFTAMQLNDGRRITKVVYSVRNNRNQFLRLKMPADAEVWSVEVGGRTVSPGKDEKDNVLIPLIRSARSARELAAFPVEMVYIQTPKEPLKSSGTIRIELPVSSAPQMHVMCNAYLPKEGKYTAGWGRSGFSGPMRIVEEFTALATGPGAEVIRRNAQAQVQQMKTQVDKRVDAQARAAGATPIRVRLPINGEQFKLERILALPDDVLWFEVRYRGWDVED